MYTKDQIIDIISKNSSSILSKYNLDFLILFGSVATGKNRLNSDIDIGFKGDFSKNLDLFSDISALLKTNHIDLVDLSKSSSSIAHLASSQAVLLYEKRPGLFAEFRTYAFKLHVETRSLRDLNFKRTLSYLHKTVSV